MPAELENNCIILLPLAPPTIRIKDQQKSQNVSCPIFVICHKYHQQISDSIFVKYHQQILDSIFVKYHQQILDSTLP